MRNPKFYWIQIWK